MDRRNFLVNGGLGLSALVVGTALPWVKEGNAFAMERVQVLNFRITDALKNMVTHNDINVAQCYFWVFKEERFPADCPGPVIVASEGDLVEVTVTNDLDEPHAFFIKDAIDSGPIAPGETKHFNFIAPTAGTYLYYDNLNAPVNRVMGLHGAFVVMPKVLTKDSTPYADPTAIVQKLFGDFGNSEHFPGLAWGEGDPLNNTPAFRQHVWLLHGASPVLFEQVGRFPPGQDYPADKFIEAYTNDPYANTFETNVFNRKPHFFTINGQSGHFVHHNPLMSPWRRVGEPSVIRIMNAGLYTHSLHIHANHIYLISINNEVQDNLLYLDTFQIHALDTVDWAVPMKRPPDIPNERGIGFLDAPLIGLNGNPVYPPAEELDMFIPPLGDPLADRLSPMCYPMHDHTEPTQTAQGGNYNMGMMAGINFTGDRTIPGALNFPAYPFEYDDVILNKTGPAAPPIPEVNGHGHGHGHGHGSEH